MNIVPMNTQTIEQRIRANNPLSLAEKHFLYSRYNTPELSGWVQTIDSELIPSDLCYHYNPQGESAAHHWTRKEGALFNPVNGLYFHPKTADVHVFYEGQVYILPSHITKELPYSSQISRKASIYAASKLPLYEHTGVAIGGPKNFKKPTDEAFGIEIETVFKTGCPKDSLRNKILFALWLKDNFPDWIVERDGSLEDGLSKINQSDFRHCCAEIVSPPMSLEDLNRSLPVIISQLKKFNAAAQRVGDFFAIHITANIYDKPALVKMARAVYDPELSSFWKKVSGRPQSDGFVGNTGKAYCKLLDFRATSDTDLVDIIMSDHYRAFFARSSGSAGELRIFQTRINRRYVLDILELTALLSRFGHSSHSNWLEFLNDNSSQYLTAYLKECGAMGERPAFKFSE